MRTKEAIMQEAVKLRLGGEQVHDPVTLSILEVLLDIRQLLDDEKRDRLRGY